MAERSERFLTESPEARLDYLRIFEK